MLRHEEHVTVSQAEYDEVEFLGPITKPQTIFLGLQAINQHYEGQEMCDISDVLKLIKHIFFAV
jgi:hypothetical protein